MREIDRVRKSAAMERDKMGRGERCGSTEGHVIRAR